MTIATELVRIALNEVGIREEGGNNLGPRVRDYQKATWLEPAAWPWCAAFTAWCLKEALKTNDGIAYLKGRDAKGFRCHDASAFGWIKWAKARELTVFDEVSDKKPEPGDFIVFDFSHIGIVTGPLMAGHVTTVEGNTNGRGERDSVSGDGVWRKTRSVALVRAYIRL